MHPSEMTGVYLKEKIRLVFHGHLSMVDAKILKLASDTT